MQTFRPPIFTKRLRFSYISKHSTQTTHTPPNSACFTYSYLHGLCTHLPCRLVICFPSVKDSSILKHVHETGKLEPLKLSTLPCVYVEKSEIMYAVVLHLFEEQHARPKFGEHCFVTCVIVENTWSYFCVLRLVEA